MEDVTKKRRLFYLGPPFSFSHKAALSTFQESILMSPVDTFDEIITSVMGTDLNIGIIPFYNIYEHHIRETQEKLLFSEIIAKAVVIQKIELYLLAPYETEIKDIKCVLSNIHVFKQCEEWLSKNLPNAKFECVSSTAKAAQEAKNRQATAGISSYEASKEYGLGILAEQIQNKNNYTFFFVIEKDGRENDKINEAHSLLCIKSSGSLAKKKLIFDAGRKYRLHPTQIWTFLHPKEDYYLFYFEFLGRIYDLDFISLEAELGKYFEIIKLVGSYDKSITDIWREK